MEEFDVLLTDISRVNIEITMGYSQCYTFKPILHYALGLCFGKVCGQKRMKNARKTQLARVFTQRIV